MKNPNRKHAWDRRKIGRVRIGKGIWKYLLKYEVVDTLVERL